MRIKVTSHRGHHECEVTADVGRMIFEKLTGKRGDPLPKSLKVPDTFQELAALWQPGQGGYTAVSSDKDGEVLSVREYNPDASEILFIAPITGG